MLGGDGGGLGAVNGLSSSFRSVYQSIVSTGAGAETASAAPPPLSLENMELLLSNLTSDQSILSTLDPNQLRLTQDLMQSVKADTASTGNWMASTRFPDLATSFNTLFSHSQLGSQAFPLLGSIGLSAGNSAVKHIPEGEEDEEEFDWNSIM